MKLSVTGQPGLRTTRPMRSRRFLKILLLGWFSRGPASAGCVESGAAVGDAAVAQAPVAAGDPVDGAFDHGPVTAVDRLEGGVGGGGAVRAQQGVVVVQGDAAAGLRGARGHGVAGRAADRSCFVVDGEVVRAEPAGNVRPGRPRLDDRGVPGAGHACEQVGGAVGGVTEDLAGPLDGGVGRQQSSADRAVGAALAGAAGELAGGDQPGVGFGDDMRLVAVDLHRAGLVDMAGVRIDGGHNPVGGDVAGDPPPAVGPVLTLHVLPGRTRTSHHR